MALHSTDNHTSIAPWHRNLLTAAAVSLLLLIAMGGILCVTQSIRSCPDWPGCFGKPYPPLETSPILEYTHRLLAALSGLLILLAAIAGLTQARRQRWIVVPPLVTLALVIEVSVFGALVVLRGLSPGWAAVDVGSALLAAALMIAAAVIAHDYPNHASLSGRLNFHSAFARLVLSTAGVIYVILVTGVLVSGKDSITACLAWPIYSPQQFQLDAHGTANILRWLLSLAGMIMIVALLVRAWRQRAQQPTIFRVARWLGVIFLLEILIQGLLLAFGLQTPILVLYTVVMAALWGSMVTLVMVTGLHPAQRDRAG